MGESKTAVVDQDAVSVSLPGERPINMQVLPTEQALRTPAPFAHFVRAVASEDYATLYFLQRPFDDRDELVALLMEAVRKDPNGNTPLEIVRRTTPVAHVMVPTSVLVDLKSVIDRLLASIERGPRIETIAVPGGAATGEGG